MEPLNLSRSRTVTDAIDNRRKYVQQDRDIAALNKQVGILSETLLHQKKAYEDELYKARQNIEDLKKSLLAEKISLTKEQCDLLLEVLQTPRREGKYGGVYLSMAPPERVYDEHGVCHNLHWLPHALAHRAEQDEKTATCEKCGSTNLIHDITIDGVVRCTICLDCSHSNKPTVLP